MAQMAENEEKPECIEVYCKCGATMKLTQPEDCSISVGLQCNNNKCKKIIGTNEWFYHCSENSSNSSIHKGPYNYCNECANIKLKLIKKQCHFTYLKEGWMNKKPTNHLIKNKQFKRRYFKLSSEWKLWYYVNPWDLYNKDMIDLNYMTSIKKRFKNGIEIYETKGKNKWLFTMENEKERDEWYDIMILAYQSKENMDQQKIKNEENTDKGNDNIMIYGGADDAL